MVRSHSPSWLRAGIVLTPSRVRARFRPGVEWLEERRLLTTWFVDTTNNDGVGSLRDAISKAAAGDDIAFNVTGTIALSSSLEIDRSITINGNNQVIISGSGLAGVFVVGASNPEIFVGIFNLTIADGLAADGAGIRNQASMNVASVSFVNNTATGAGGAIFNSGSLGCFNCTFVANSALDGAAVFNAVSGTGNLTSATLVGNTPAGFAGALVNTNPEASSFFFDDIIEVESTGFTATAGVAFVDRVVATFTDSSPRAEGDYNIRLPDIDWGDDSATSFGRVVALGGGRFAVLGSHTYNVDTTFPVSVQVHKFVSDFFLDFSIQSNAAVLTRDQAATLIDFDLQTALPGDEVVIASSTGVTATLLLGNTDAAPPATLFVGTFAGNPEDAASAGLVFYDVRVTNVPPGSVLTVTFAYPGFAGDQVFVQYFDVVSQTYQLVQAPTFINAVADTVTIVLTDATIPSLAMLSHTVFTIALAPAPAANQAPAATATTTINPFIVSATNSVSGQVSAPISTSFSSSAPVTLTLTPLQQTTLRGSQSAVGGSEASAETRGAFGITGGSSEEVPFKWVWNLLRLDEVLQWLQPASGRMEEAQPPMDEPPMETWLEMPLFFPGQGLPAPAAPAASAGAAPLLPVPQADALAAQDAQRLACIGLAFAGAVGLCAEKRRRACS